MNFNINLNLDQVLGMFAAHFIGDALGAGYEFKTSNFANYTGVINSDLYWSSRWIGTKVGPKGQTTDDTAMTLCLLAVLMQNQGHYINSQAIQAYNIWASGPAGYTLTDNNQTTNLDQSTQYTSKSFTTRMIGTNTSTLFKYQVKPENVIKSFLHRYEKKFVNNGDVAQQAQSNGCLMRCTPFALLIDFAKYAHQDCYLTNPNAICWECNNLYLLALREILSNSSDNNSSNNSSSDNNGSSNNSSSDNNSSSNNYNSSSNNSSSDNNSSSNSKSGMNIYKMLRSTATIPEIQAVFNIIDEGNFPAVKKNKGWILHALAVVLRAILFIDSPDPKLQDFFDWVIQLGGDTDTNACIGGAIIGAYLGYDKIITESKSKQNWDIITSVDISSSQLDTRSEYQGKNLRVALQNLFN